MSIIITFATYAFIISIYAFIIAFAVACIIGMNLISHHILEREQIKREEERDKKWREWRSELDRELDRKYGRRLS